MISNTYIYIHLEIDKKEGPSNFSVIVHMVILKNSIFFLLVCFSILNFFTLSKFYHCNLTKTLSLTKQLDWSITTKYMCFTFACMKKDFHSAYIIKPSG